MDDVILRHLCGEATDDDQRVLEQWRAATPENEIQFRRLQALWQGLARVEDRHPPAPLPDVDAMIREAERRRAASHPVRFPKPAYRSLWAGYLLAAAAVVMLVFIGTRLWPLLPQSSAPLTIEESSTAATGVAALTLSDGTFVRTMPGTRLEFPSAAGRRLVDLEGQAFFAVAPGAEPFVVWTAAGEVAARGTRFEVRTDEPGVRVVVAEGEVEFTAAGKTVMMSGGDVAAFQIGGPLKVGTTDSPKELWSLLDWPGGLLAFQGTPLGDVAAQLELQFGVPVHVGDQKTAQLRLTGSFQDTTVKDVASAVCAVTGLSCGSVDGAIVLGIPAK